MTARHARDTLVAYARHLLEAAGLDAAIAVDVAEVLVEGDLLGHDTHGLALLAGYLTELDKGSMTRAGSYEVVNARGAAALWDGKRLPGPWLVRRAMDAAATMARTHGTGTVVIRRSHHIACLAAYLRVATEQGFVMQLQTSDPNVASVAPFGGTQAVFTPDPLAIGFPTAGDPVLIDISASLTTNGMSNRLRAQGRQYEHPFLIDAQGRESRDPAVLFDDPPGTILPVGGKAAGHKGYGLALLVETLTGGLAGFGRADPKEGWGATVFLQLLDPEAFGGVAALQRQTQWLADACRASRPVDGGPPVRLPGEGGLKRRRAHLEQGIELHPAILPALAPWARRYGVAAPA